MEWWQIVLVSILSVIAVVLLAALILWRMATQRTRALGKRIGKLPWRSKLELAGRLVMDDRMPLTVRIVPALLVLYLALPLDLIPDFIPVLGQLDDIVVLLAGVALLVRFAPMKVIDEHLLDLEAFEMPTDRPLPLPPGDPHPKIGE